MSTPTPTGQLIQVAEGYNLVLTRSLAASIQEVWTNITEPDHTSHWFGRWEGTGVVGETIKLQLGFEQDAPWADVQIVQCDAPHILRILTIDEGGSWDLALELVAAEGRTDVRFIMRDVDPGAIGEIGPGWEYYLDQLVASMSDAPLPNFDDYFPAQREYFEQQVP